MNPLTKVLAAALAVLAILGAFYVQHQQLQEATTLAADEKRRADSAERIAKDRKTDTVVVTEYVDRVQVVKERGRDIIVKVPVYVPKEADDRCIVNAGFVRVHDAAAANVQLGDPGDADAAPSGIALSTVAATVAGNYTAAHETAEQLIALQTLLRRRQENHAQAE
ncbi:hypothetical protein [Cupriavidus nantongensis]|uniref:Uncharacterized protein n=1 Tax=Cupriavidus nantongensis TaxID=1796606 RepID=A0A142JGU6_9BURK|nr:hypothetical protein [Cupriavidus nantongensis]AMR77308.1 hypothetical protein A2G96_05930 [Cupriavidus nantongensis]